MFKSVFTIASLFLCLNAFAMPSVGDQAVYDTTVTQGENVYPMVSIFDLLEMDLANQRALVRQTTKMDGQPDEVEEGWQDSNQLPTEEMMTMLLAQCVQQGGKNESITVAAGTFDTCAMPESGGGTIWLGVAPFGLVKAYLPSKEGNTLKLELRSYRK